MALKKSFWKKFALVTLVIIVCAVPVGYLFLKSQHMFASDPVYSTSNGAIDGYDPVAYHTLGKAIAGNPEISYDWQGARWHFSSEAHKLAFMLEPDKYAPAYGGYCAFAVSDGVTWKVDPEAWFIQNDKLMLMYNDFTVDEWKKNETQRFEDAEKAWPKILNKM